MKNALKGILVILIGAVCAADVAADDGIDVLGYVGLSSDLRQRGLSLSEREPAPYGLLRLEYGGGLSGDLYVARANDGRGSDVLVSGALSYSREISGYTLGFSAQLDSFHGSDRSVTYQTFGADLSRDFGLVILDLGVDFSPFGRWNTPQNASLYLNGGISYPVPDLPDMTLFGTWGYDVRDALSNVFDWSVGASYFFKDIELVLAVEDSDIGTSFIGDRTDQFSFGALNLTAALRYYF